MSNWNIYEGDCVESMRAMPDDSIDAVVCDPPYGIGFMGSAWDTFDSSTLAERVGTRNGAGPPSNSRDGRHKGWTTSAFANGAGEAGAYDFSPSANQRFQAWCEAWATEAFRVLKPGGHLLASGGTRTSHRLAAGIEDAGFEIRDSLIWIYGSGFPKSLDVGKAIDKAERGVPQGGANPTSVNHGKFKTQATEGKRGASDEGRGYGAGPGQFMAEGGEADDRELVDAARPWQGWGTALKPGHEPIVAARKPLIGTVAANVLEHGTGALNIDGCRIDASGESLDGGRVSSSTEGWDRPYKRDADTRAAHIAAGAVKVEKAEALGRWPANLILSHTEDCVCVGERRVKGATSVERNRDGEVHNEVFGAYRKPARDDQGYADEDGLETVEAWECAPGCPVAALDAQSGTLMSGRLEPHHERRSPRLGNGGVYGDDSGDMASAGRSFGGDTGGASRFFYCAKASRAERNAGLIALPTSVERATVTPTSTIHKGRSGSERVDDREYTPAPRANVHPTVKPVELMRWLVRLVTPPGGTVLDPFTGSGTTGCAAVLEGFDFIGCERQGPEWKLEHPDADDYVAIANARIAWWVEHPEGVETTKLYKAERRRVAIADAGQGDLF